MRLYICHDLQVVREESSPWLLPGEAVCHPVFERRIADVGRHRGMASEWRLNHSRRTRATMALDQSALLDLFDLFAQLKPTGCHRSHPVGGRDALSRAGRCGSDRINRGFPLRLFCGAKHPAQWHEALDVDYYCGGPGVENSKAAHRGRSSQPC